MPVVYLIRHARPASTWGDLQADPDPGLDAEGWVQARAAAAALMALPEDQRPQRVVSSPLQRCRDTAQPLAEALGVEIMIEPAVAEIPTPAKVSKADRAQWLREAFTGEWGQIVGDIDYSAWAAGVAEAAAQYPGAAVFSHFVAINAAVSVAVGDPKVRQFEPGHASISTFRITDDGLVLVTAGAAASTQIL